MGEGPILRAHLEDPLVVLRAPPVARRAQSPLHAKPDAERLDEVEPLDACRDLRRDVEIARVLLAGGVRERYAGRPRVHRDPLAEERGDRGVEFDSGPPLIRLDATAVRADDRVDRLRWRGDGVSLPEVVRAQAVDRWTLAPALHAEHRWGFERTGDT